MSHNAMHKITKRQREVLHLMALGYNNCRIARDLFVTVKAVDRHISSIFVTLGLDSSIDCNRRVLAVTSYLASSGSSPTAGSR